MILEEIILEIEKSYPKENAENWDNIGLIVGDKKKEVKKIMLALDADMETINLGINENIDLLITHHPLIFAPIKAINTDTLIGKKIIKAIKKDMAIYSIHTNIDTSFQGLNEYILDKLEIKNFKVLERNTEKKEVGIGRYYKVEKNYTIEEYIGYIKEKLELDRVILYAGEKKGQNQVKKIALVNGAGVSYWKKAYLLGCDTLITGDVKYHDALDAIEMGMKIVDIGHYESEKLFLEIMEKKLNEKFLDLVIKKNLKSPIWRVI